MPKEITKQGRFDEHLKSFMRENGEALSIDEVLIDKVFTDKDDVSWFTLSALESFLKSRKFNILSIHKETFIKAPHLLQQLCSPEHKRAR